jgi:hypothetical protein
MVPGGNLPILRARSNRGEDETTMAPSRPDRAPLSRFVRECQKWGPAGEAVRPLRLVSLPHAVRAQSQVVGVNLIDQGCGADDEAQTLMACNNDSRTESASEG